MRSRTPTCESVLGLSIMTAEAQDVAVDSDETGTIVELRFSI